MISAKIIADSISDTSRLTTFELEMPRIILAEFNTHRVFSRNAQSTRAVPLRSAIRNTLADPFIPVFTENQRGMESNNQLRGQWPARFLWRTAMYGAVSVVWLMDKLGVSKQHAGRLLEPFQYVRVVCTSTEWTNFLRLRGASSAQPEIQQLAKLIKEQLASSKPKRLNKGDWHVPYYGKGYWTSKDSTPLQEAIELSCSCCAQVSYRKLDVRKETAHRIYTTLVKEEHASPLEHQATPAISWRGNFDGWEQHRHIRLEGW